MDKSLIQKIFSSEIKHYIPGQFHWTTLLNVFSPLFNKVKRELPVEELKYHNVPSLLKVVQSIFYKLMLPKIFQAVASAPVTPEQTPFLLNSANSEINPIQEAILECVRVIFQEEIDPSSKLRSALPDLLRLLMAFSLFAIRQPVSEFVVPPSKDPVRKFPIPLHHPQFLGRRIPFMKKEGP